MREAAVAEPRRSPDVVSYGSVKDERAQTGETERENSGSTLWSEQEIDPLCALELIKRMKNKAVVGNASYVDNDLCCCCCC